MRAFHTLQCKSMYDERRIDLVTKITNHKIFKTASDRLEMHAAMESNEVLDLIFIITRYKPMNWTTSPYFKLILLVFPS